MSGSTLYRRLPNGTWAAQREDSSPMPPLATPAPPAAPVAAAREQVVIRPSRPATAGARVAGPQPPADPSPPARPAVVGPPPEVAPAVAAAPAAPAAPPAAPPTVTPPTVTPPAVTPTPAAPIAPVADTPASARDAGLAALVAAAVAPAAAGAGAGAGAASPDAPAAGPSAPVAAGFPDAAPAGSAPGPAGTAPAHVDPAPVAASVAPGPGATALDLPAQPAQPPGPPVGPQGVPARPVAGGGQPTGGGPPRGGQPPAPPRGAPRPGAAPRPPRRRRSRVRIAALVVGGAVLAYVTWVVGLLIYMTVSLPTVEAMPAEQVPDTKGTVWLMVGSDSREGLTAEQQRELTTGGDVGKRTDTIMLVHMAPGQAPTMISIPRDSWVAIPAHTASDGTEVGLSHAKVNAAYAYGGPQLLTETIEYNTGLHVDHYVEVGFTGIVSLTEAVGGIEACFDKAINDKNSGLKVEAGCQVLDGPQSLAYVRMRYSDPKGDLGRIERQQKYVAAVIDQVISWQTVVNPFRQLAIVNAALAAVTVDEGTGAIDLARFGVGMGQIAQGKGEVTTVPMDETDHWEGGQWVIHWDEAASDELFGSLGAGTPPAQQ